MKTLSRDILLIVVTAVITSAIFILVDFDKDKDQPLKEVAGFSHPYKGSKGNGKWSSSYSDYTSMINKLKRYNDSLSNNVLLTQYVDSSGGKVETVTNTLQAFTFDADQLIKLINHSYGSKKKVQAVLFYLGADTSTANFTYLGKSYNRITLSAIGMDGDGKLLYEIPKAPAPFDAPNETVLDQADPCPPNGAIDVFTSQIVLPGKPKK